jgi:hypothetical protein
MDREQATEEKLVTPQVRLDLEKPVQKADALAEEA